MVSVVSRYSIKRRCYVPGKTYDLYLTGSNPQHTRFYMLHAQDEESIVLAVYYNSPQRIDVFVDEVYVYPSNAQKDPYALLVGALTLYIYISLNRKLWFVSISCVIVTVYEILPIM